MSGRSGASVRQRLVSAELRELRKKAGLTCKDAALALGVSVAKVSRMETGERGLVDDDVAALLGLYRVPAQRRTELLHLVRNCHEPNWWQISRHPSRMTTDIPAAWRDYASFESGAAAIVNFEPTVIPGLAQTREYTTAMFAGVKDWAQAHTQQLVAVRMARKSVLNGRTAPIVTLIVDEAVLCRVVGGPKVMADQLRHLVAFGQRPNLTVRVVPFTAGATPGLEGPASLCDLRDGKSVVFVESQGLSAFLSDTPAISRVRTALAKTASQALSPVESAWRIREAAEKFEASSPR